jgi:hypothetical protein
MAKVNCKNAQQYRETKANFDRNPLFSSIRQANLDALKALREIEDSWLKKIYYLWWKKRN